MLSSKSSMQVTALRTAMSRCQHFMSHFSSPSLSPVISLHTVELTSFYICFVFTAGENNNLIFMNQLTSEHLLWDRHHTKLWRLRKEFDMSVVP